MVYPAGMEKGQRIGRFNLLEKIGRGGMAEIFKAEETLPDGSLRSVAIKRLFPRLSADREFVAMFVNEAAIAASMNHPNIIRTYDLINYGSYYYIVMEYLEGMDLEDLCFIYGGGRGFLSLEETAWVVHQTALGLAYAHSGQSGKLAGPVVHRDISPGNILASVRGEVKITDFGIARALQYASFTRPGVLKGKYEYMAPEYVKGKPFDGRADLFSLGVVFYELLTGQNPFAAPTAQQIWKRVVEEEPPSAISLVPGLPARVDRVLEKALEKDPRRRFQTGLEFAQALEKALPALDAQKVAASLGQKVSAILQTARAASAKQEGAEPRALEIDRTENTREVYLDELLQLVEPREVPVPQLQIEAEPTVPKVKSKSLLPPEAIKTAFFRRRWFWLGAGGILTAVIIVAAWFFWPGEKTGWLTVTSDVPAEVVVNGENYGPTPIEELKLPAGEYRIVLRRLDGAGEKTYQRQLEAGQRLDLKASWTAPKKKKRPSRKKRSK